MKTTIVLSIFSYLVVSSFTRSVISCDDFLPTISESPIDGLDDFNDADRLGGLEEIDKIVKIEVYTDDLIFRNVISKIKTTYLRTDGLYSTISNGKGGSSIGTVEFDEGQYLTKIEIFAGLHVKYIKFCRTDGSCFGPFGSSRNEAPNRILYKQRSVIKSFLGKADRVVDRLRVYYESNKVYRAELGEIVYQNITTPAIISHLTFESPKAKVTVDNLASSVEQSSTLTFEETVSTRETTIVTKTKQISGTVSLYAAPGITYRATALDASVTFTFGTSFTSTLAESNTKELRTTIAREYTVKAPPFSLVTGQAYWSQIKYAYNWTTQVLCFFTYDPHSAISGGDIQGNMFGTQAFPQSYVKFTQQLLSPPPSTVIPPPVVINDPTRAPIKKKNSTDIKSPVTVPLNYDLPTAQDPTGGNTSPVTVPHKDNMFPMPAPIEENISPVSAPKEQKSPVSAPSEHSNNPSQNSTPTYSSASPVSMPIKSQPMSIPVRDNEPPTSFPFEVIIPPQKKGNVSPVTEMPDGTTPPVSNPTNSKGNTSPVSGPVEVIVSPISGEVTTPVSPPLESSVFPVAAPMENSVSPVAAPMEISVSPIAAPTEGNASKDDNLGVTSGDIVVKAVTIWTFGFVPFWILY